MTVRSAEIGAAARTQAGEGLPSDRSVVIRRLRGLGLVEFLARGEYRVL